MSTIRTAVIEHVGDSNFHAATGTGRAIDFGDAERGALSPVETVLAALGACTAMDVISIAAKKRQAIDEYRSTCAATSATNTRRSTPRSRSSTR